MITKVIRTALRAIGLEVRRHSRSATVNPPSQYHDDMEPDFREMHGRCVDATMTSSLRMYALYNAVRYVVERGLPGAVVECGV